MEFLDLVKKRESIRNYDPSRLVPRDTLLRVLEAGRHAPSAVNKQPWQFIVVYSQGWLDKIRDSYPRSWFQEAPNILIVKGFKDQAWVRSYDAYNSIETDLAIAMDHLVLAATAEGLSTCWIAAFDNTKLRAALGLNDNEVIFAMTPLGYPKADFVSKAVKTRKPVEAITVFL